MKLRSKLLALSLLTLLLPWSAWKLLQELESFLRDNQETSLLASAHTLSGALPLEFQSQLLFAPSRTAPLRPLARLPVLDGYSDEWPEPEESFEIRASDGATQARLLAGEFGGLIHLYLEVADDTPVRATPGVEATAGDAVRLWLRNARGLQSWTISPEAQGPVRIRTSGAGGGELEGYWLDTAEDPGEELRAGFRLEVTLPVAVQASSPGMELAVEILDIEEEGSGTIPRWATAADAGPGTWISLVAQWQDLSAWLASAAPAQARAWVVDRYGWVLADSGSANREVSRTTWLQRWLYRMVSDDRPAIEEPWSEPAVRLVSGAVTSSLEGQPSSEWSQDLDNAVVRNTVSVPVEVKSEILGAVVLQSRSDGLLLITNRALGQLLLTTVGLMLGLAAGLWYFASRLSRRVQRLSGAVSRAMDQGVPDSDLPLTRDRDELGELARNNARLLRAVADYTNYLQTLAGKLSHELKTPLAITRSSLDNLGSLSLDDEARPFLDRAREGLDRQTAIVRAMSEASRLEQAIEVAEWEAVDLEKLVASSAEGYRAVHPGRRIETRLQGKGTTTLCAPDLLAQALDKLVDNAITMSRDEDRITIAVESNPGEIRLSVRNTGSRLPEALQDRLFDSLVSVREQHRDAPHLGLGLYIVRLVAEAHGGRALARNLDGGEGVEFTIALPHNA
jgi:two-component system sensor histidine kinase ChvG